MLEYVAQLLRIEKVQATGTNSERQRSLNPCHDKIVVRKKRNKINGIQMPDTVKFLMWLNKNKSAYPNKTRKIKARHRARNLTQNLYEIVASCFMLTTCHPNWSKGTGTIKEWLFLFLDRKNEP